MSLSPSHSLLFPTSPDIVDNALLLASLPNLSPPHFLATALAFAIQHTRQRLVVVLFSRFFNAPHPRTYPTSIHPVSHPDLWDPVQGLLTHIYVHATKVAHDAGKMLFNVDVLIKGLNEDLDPEIGTGMDIVFRIGGDACAVPLPESISFLRHCYLPTGDNVHDFDATAGEASEPTCVHSSLYPVVALGGTFDHLHAGHKILLSMGVWITGQKLIVGITDDTLLQNKAFNQVMEPLAQRMARVLQFLTFLKANIVYDIVPITDVCGPAGWDPNIQALVVSKETESGRDSIAERRAKEGLPRLDSFVIDVISATSASLDHTDIAWLKETKLSSSFLREWIMKQQGEETKGGREIL